MTLSVVAQWKGDRHESQCRRGEGVSYGVRGGVTGVTGALADPWDVCSQSGLRCLPSCQTRLYPVTVGLSRRTRMAAAVASVAICRCPDQSGESRQGPGVVMGV